MNSLYDTYGLPPPPGPEPFSRDFSPGRGMLPDLMTLYPSDPTAQMDHLKHFLEKLFYWEFSRTPGFWLQIKVCSGLIAALAALSGFIIAKRLRERAFWMVRFAVKREGLIIIPNAVSCFTVMEGVYCILAIALCFELSSFFEYHKKPTRVMLWVTMPWISLLWGAAYSCWGAILAAPERSGSKPSRFNMRAVIKRPLLANSICLGLPLVQSVSVLVPSVMASVRWDAALGEYEVWLTKYGNDTSLSRGALVDAIHIFNGALSGAFCMAVVFSIWSVWAALFFYAFSKVTAGLFFDIVRHARRLNSTFARQETPSWRDKIPKAFMVRSISRRDRTTGSVGKASSLSGHWDTEDGIANPHALVSPSSLASEFPLSSMGRDAESGETIERRRARAIEAGLDEMMQIGADTIHIFSEREIAEDQPHTSFFPAVKPSKVIGKTAAATRGSSTRQHHARLFRRLVVNFGFQFSGICVAILVFLSIALYLASNVYACVEANDIARTVPPAILMAMWATAVFGFITLSAIAARTYETALPPGGLSQTGQAESAPNAGLFTEMPAANSVLEAGDRRKGKKIPFTRATKKATQLAHEVTLPGAEETFEEYRLSPPRRAPPAAIVEDKENIESVDRPRQQPSVTFEQWTKFSGGQKLLTPEDFQAKKPVRVPRTPSRPNSSSGKEVDLEPAAGQPMSPSTRRTYSIKKSLQTVEESPRPAGNTLQQELKEHLMGTELVMLNRQGRQQQPHSRIAFYPQDETPTATQTVDYSQEEAAHGDDSDLE